jgi:hypothetical protein
MRLTFTALVLVTATASAACGIETSTTERPTDITVPAEQPPPAPHQNPPTTLGQPTVAPPAEDALSPVVYVLMRDKAWSRWFCTGTLVSKETVVTAAHCLDTKQFVSYEIVAPHAPNSPRVAASSPRVFGGDYADVANPDIGTLTLSKPIVLVAYAELTDVTARVEAGEEIEAAAIVREKEELEAPLHEADHVRVSSTVQYGYEHGFGTPRFSNGGDSGAGLFLVENGKRTQKLIGVARQPEPARELDHFTRFDAAFLEWYVAR